MTSKTNDLKLTDEQKTRLLGFALESERSDAPGNKDEEKGDLLCDIFRCPLPATENLPSNTKGVLLSLHSAVGPPLGQLLNDPTTDVAVLGRIKDYVKSTGDHAACEVEKDVFLAVYFAAIAAALVFHDRRITRHSARNLAKFVAFFAKAQWVPVDLRKLFHMAADRFRETEKREVRS